MLSEGFVVSLSLHDASQATRLESVSLGRTCTGWLMCPWLDTPIAQRLKKESPFTDTLVVTLADGAANSGYIPSDDAYGHNTFQVLGSRLKPGCAENAIVNSELDLMTESMK